MAARRPITSALAALLHEQDGLASARQLGAHGFDDFAVSRRVRSGIWQRPLPGVVATFSGTPTRRQLLVAGWLYAGPDSAIDGTDACDWYGVRTDGFQLDRVHVVAPSTSTVRSTGFLVVRRAISEIRIGSRGAVPYVDAPTAFIVAARGARTTRSAVSTLSRGLQLGLITTSELRDARERIGDKWCRPVDGALVAVGVGLRSPAEVDYHDLVGTSLVLPQPRWNQWLDLGDHGPWVCVDGLLDDAGMALEVIGKKYHAWGEQYEKTQARKERLQAAGLLVAEATPTRIRTRSAALLASLERTYLLHAGRGMPGGVRLVDPPPIADH